MSSTSLPNTGTGAGPDGQDTVVDAPRTIYHTFWQNPIVQDVVPFLSSLMIHALVIVLAVATYQGYKQFVKVEKEQEIIPDSEITDGQIGGIPNPGLGDDPNTRATQDKVA